MMTIALEQTETTEKLEIIELSGGKLATQKPVRGRDYFKFKQLAAKDLGEATRWLMLRMFEVDGKPLTIDMIEDEMPFEDLAQLDGIINGLFLRVRLPQT